MKNYTKAFFAKYTAKVGGLNNSAYLLTGGRLYEDSAPERGVFPYTVYEIFDAGRDYVFGGKGGDEIGIQLSIYSNSSSADELKDISEAFKNLYDGATLSPATGTFVNITLDHRSGFQPDEEGIRRHDLDFELSFRD